MAVCEFSPHQGKERVSKVVVFILLKAPRPSQLIAIMYMISRGQMNKEKKDYFADL